MGFVALSAVACSDLPRQPEMNSVERVTGRSHSESATRRQTAGSIVLPAEFLLRLLAVLLPFIAEIFRRHNDKRNECPDGGQSEQ